MQVLLDVILPVFVVIGFGYLVAWRRIFSESAVEGLVQFTQNFAIPCLLFQAISQIDLAATVSVPLIVTYYSGAFFSFFTGLIGARVLFRRNAVDAVAIGFCCLFSNTILLGLPIMERAFGPESLADNYAIIAFHAPLCYLVGVTAMEIARGHTGSFPRKVGSVLKATLRNPMVIGIGLGLVVNITGLRIPDPVDSGVAIIAQAALPAALFGLGGILVQYRPEGDLPTIAMICAISLILHPAIVWSMGKAFSLDTDAFRSALVTAAMAPGANTYIFSNMYGAARRVVASSVLIATAASTVSIWLWLSITP